MAPWLIPAQICVSENHVRKTMGLAELSEPEVRAMIGDGLTMLLKRLLPDGTDIDWAKGVFAQHYDDQCVKNSWLYPGLKPVLFALKEAQWDFALVSNKPQRWCEPILKQMESNPLFTAIRGGDGIRKPAADPLIDVCAGKRKLTSSTR